MTAQNEKGKDWFQILAILSSSLTTLTYGISFAWCSPSTSKIVSDKQSYDISLEEASYFAVIPPLVSICVSFIFAKLLDVVGRKYLLLFIVIPHATAWILVSLAESIYIFYAARVATGIGDSCMITVLPVYVAEISTPKVRGTWGNIMTLLVFLGQFLINIIGGYLSVKHAAYVCLIFPILFVCSFVFMPESPYYLIMKERYDEAEIALRKLRRQKNVKEELEILKINIKRQLSESGTWSNLFKIQSNRRALCAGIFLRTSQQCTGLSAFTVYTQYIFTKSGGSISALTFSMIFTGLFVVTTFCSIFTIDLLGRRKSFLISLIFCGLILGVEALYFYMNSIMQLSDFNEFNWIPIAGMIIFVFAFSIGLGMVPMLMLGELFSSSIKSKALCLVNIIFFLGVCVTTKLFHLMESSFGLYSPFVLYSVSCLISIFLTLHLVPETKGKTLEQIQQDLKRKKDVLEKKTKIII